MVTHSNILARRIPRTVEHGGLQTTRSQKSWTRLSVSKQEQQGSTYHTYSVNLLKMLICLGQTPLLHLKFPLWLPLALSEKHQVLPDSTRLCLCLSSPLPPHLRCSGQLSTSMFTGVYCCWFFFWCNTPATPYEFSFLWPCGMWDPSSPTRDQTHALEALSLYHWMAGEVPCVLFVDFSRHTQTTWSHLQPCTQFHTSKAAEQHYG